MQGAWSGKDEYLTLDAASSALEAALGEWLGEMRIA